MGESEPMADTLKVGLLMEAAQAQQRLGEEALARLSEHLRGLDDLVRTEVARTVAESLATLQSETEQVAGALRQLRRAADVRLFLCSLAVTAASLAIGTQATWIR